MPVVGNLAFAAPAVLLAFVILPVIWWLLRVTPPAPKRVAFPPVRLLFGLARQEETPAKTPPWLIALRLLLASLLILALAQPLINPGARLQGAGPLVIVVDDGWAAARNWERRQEAIGGLLDNAERTDRPVVLITTALTADGAPEPRLVPAQEARDIARALEPKPWGVDRAAAAAALERLSLNGAAEVVWLGDGLDYGDADDFAARLQGLGRLQVMLDPDLDRPRVLTPPEIGPDTLRLGVWRAATGGEERLWVRASDEGGVVLARAQVSFAAGETRAEARIEAPVELRNRIARLTIEGERGAGAMVLLDERWRRRPVGLVSGAALEAQQPLLSEVFYLERALNPYSEVRKGILHELLARPLAVLVLADVAKVIGVDHDLLAGWVDGGGVLIRFAGPRMAEGADDLVPVRLRGGGRVLGGALSWSRPARLADFEADSPFAGLKPSPEILVRRQVLAEPTLDPSDLIWARLTDGTPLVTARQRGDGWLVLVHTTASAAWSDLAISGLFVEMLHRLVQLSQGVAGDRVEGMLAPFKTLDGRGRLGDPPASARAIAAADFAAARIGPQHPPGFYGVETARRALNLTAGLDGLEPLGALPEGVERRELAGGGEIDLKPWLLAAALALALLDLVIGLVLRGLWSPRLRGALGVLALLALTAAPAAAQDSDDGFALAATLHTRLAYVITGDDVVDSVSRAGLEGLSIVLSDRTSVEPEAPLGVDVEHDEMIFFPLIYWPITPTQAGLSADAIVKLDHYLKTGGIVLFDTRDQNAGPSEQVGGVGPGALRLRDLLRELNIPPLVPVPPEHVLTRAFYLLQDFPGRWTGGQLWVERHEGGVNDGVSSLIIGSHDWAAAWAMDDRRRPAFAVVPGGERQREMAFRFGVNLTMYAMTGNYKADQVHLPAILERLGQ